VKWSLFCAQLIIKYGYYQNEVLTIFTGFSLTWKTWKTPAILC